jgi:hypothetical protein
MTSLLQLSIEKNSEDDQEQNRDIRHGICLSHPSVLAACSGNDGPKPFRSSSWVSIGYDLNSIEGSDDFERFNR